MNQEAWKGKSYALLVAFLAAGSFHWALSSLPVDLKPLVVENKAPVEVWSKDSAPDPQNKISDEKQVVMTLKAPENQSLKDKPAAFLGEFDNRVEEETQAFHLGRLKEAPPEGNPGEDGQSLAELMPYGTGPQRFADEIRKGAQTVLNTDRVAYASFINRVAEEIRDSWTGHVRDAMESLEKKRSVHEELYVTRIQVTLNGEGEVSSVQILKRSGEETIDAAPGKAFWDASHFPNPPAQLVQEDGFVRLPFDFILEVNRSLFSVVPLRV